MIARIEITNNDDYAFLESYRSKEFVAVINPLQTEAAFYIDSALVYITSDNFKIVEVLNA